MVADDKSPFTPGPGGEAWPRIGLGSWRFGERGTDRDRDIAAVRHALDIGYRLIDTAEMYGEGGAEEVIGHALADAQRAGLRRDELRLVSKFYPQHASAALLRRACERSLARLGVDQLDLYLLHWRGGVPLAKMVDTLCELQQRGRIRHWGVSNFDHVDMQELHAAPGGSRCAANQVYYSLGTRGVEFDLLPWHARQRVMTMAYSPIDQGALATHPALSRLAEEAGLPAARLALAWSVRQAGVVAIPMSANRQRQADNLAAASLSLGAELLARLDGLFPPPTKKMPLATT